MVDGAAFRQPGTVKKKQTIKFESVKTECLNEN